MNRGEVWRVNFDPSVGGAIQKLRPAVIVSHDAANRNLNRPQGVPITRGVQKLYPGEAYVTLNGEPRKAVAEPDHDGEQGAVRRQNRAPVYGGHEEGRAGYPSSTRPRFVDTSTCSGLVQ